MGRHAHLDILAALVEEIVDATDSHHRKGSHPSGIQRRAGDPCITDRASWATYDWTGKDGGEHLAQHQDWKVRVSASRKLLVVQSHDAPRWR